MPPVSQWLLFSHFSSRCLRFFFPQKKRKKMVLRRPPAPLLSRPSPPTHAHVLFFIFWLVVLNYHLCPEQKRRHFLSFQKYLHLIMFYWVKNAWKQILGVALCVCVCFRGLKPSSFWIIEHSCVFYGLRWAASFFFSPLVSKSQLWCLNFFFFGPLFSCK
jgi:hypothetical protein